MLHHCVFRFSAVSYTNTDVGVPGRWEVSIKLDLKENGLTGVPQDRDRWQCLVNVLMNFFLLLIIIIVPCILITSRFFSPTNAPFY